MHAHSIQGMRTPAHMLPGGINDAPPDTPEGTTTETAIPTVFHRLSAQATNTNMARWRKRFLTQGQIPTSTTLAQFPKANAPDLVPR